MPVALGIDLGNAKVKFCSVAYYHDNKPSIKWKSYSLPSTVDKRYNFRTGLQQRLDEFLRNELQQDINNIDIFVLCSSNAYSFTTFSQGTYYNAQIATDIFPSDKIFMIADNGDLFHPADVLNMTGMAPYKFALTNAFGSAYLGSHLIKNGLSMDIGTTTTDIIPIKNNQIDPDGLKDSVPYVQHRYYSRKINWYGLTVTPLYSIVSEVVLNKKRYGIVTRSYNTDIVFSVLFEQYKNIIGSHAYRDHYPSIQEARLKLAQFIGLDDYLLTPGDIDKIAVYVYKKLIKKISGCIKYVLRNEFHNQKTDELEVTVFALGQDLLAKPALIDAGINENKIRNLTIGQEIDLYSASSAYALAVKGIESIEGKKVLNDLIY